MVNTVPDIASVETMPHALLLTGFAIVHLVSPESTAINFAPMVRQDPTVASTATAHSGGRVILSREPASKYHWDLVDWYIGAWSRRS